MGGQGGGGGGRGRSSGRVLGIVGIVVAFVVTATGHATLSRIGSIVSGAQPTCSDPKWLLQVPIIKLLRVPSISTRTTILI